MEELRRLPTRIRGLDSVLRGGLTMGSLNLLRGASGTGKTVLCSEVCFRHAAEGKRAMFITMHAESHGKLLSQLSEFSFFDASVAGNTIKFISGTATMNDPALHSLKDLINSALHDFQPQIVILDDLDAIRDIADPGATYSQFLSAISSLASLHDSVIITIGHCREDREQIRGAASVDGIISLRTKHREMRTLRELEVDKLRGSPFLEGRHAYNIDTDGVAVSPRMESWFPLFGSMPEEQQERLGFGVPELDKMLNGGILAGSSTLLLGATGTGKTVLSLHFLAEGARQGETSLYIGFHESAQRVAGKARQLSLPIDAYLASGAIVIDWHSPGNHSLDSLGEAILKRIDETGATRLCIDGIDAFEMVTFYDERLPMFLAALSNELRGRGVTVISTEETRSLTVHTMPSTAFGVSAQVENILLLRQTEYQAKLRRLLSVIKMREGDYDSSVREFRISSAGLALEATSDSAREISATTPHEE